MEVAACGQVLNAFGGKREDTTIRTTVVTRNLFFAEGVLKSHEVSNFRFSFFIFHF
jgi:hypothetical protein